MHDISNVSPVSRGTLPRHGSASCHQKPLPRRLHWWTGVREGVVGGEGYRMDRLGRGVGWGGASSPVDSLYWPTKALQ